MQPNCVRCNGTTFTWTTSSNYGVMGKFIYCSHCGAVVTWIPDTQDRK